MNKFIDIIKHFDHGELPETELLITFLEQIRIELRACALALISTEGLSEPEYRIESFIQKTAGGKTNKLSEPVDLNDTLSILCRGRASVFDDTKPIVLQGEEYGISAIFNGIFSEYIDAVSIPVYQLNGVNRWILLLFTERDLVRRVDLEYGMSVVTFAANCLFNYENVRRLEKANEWINAELESAARVKELLISNVVNDYPGVRIAHHYEPYCHAGGDFFEIVNLEKVYGEASDNNARGSTGFMIADASGHGAASAIEIAMFDAILRTYKPVNTKINDPGKLLSYVNEHFFTRNIRGNIITSAVCNYIPADNMVCYANAGHPAPILKKANTNEVIILDDTPGIPLGVDKNASWASSSVSVSAGDILILYSDGVTELKSENSEFFGIDRLLQVIERSEAGLDNCISSICKSMSSHKGVAANSDDLTLLVIEIEK